MQHFYVLTGTGGNGKGKLMTLLEECLADYYQAISPALLTRKREEASKANEALMVFQKARLAVAQEADANDVIQAGMVKSLTGEDTLSARENYGKQLKFKTHAKVFFVCNDIPKLSESTLAMWRRVKVIHFPTSFVESPTLPHERKVDFNIDEKLKAAAPYFIPMLVRFYRKFKEEGLVEPPDVKRATEDYRKGMDLALQFVNECLEKSPGHIIEARMVTPKYDAFIFKETNGRKSSKAERDKLREYLGGPATGTRLARDKWEQIVGYEPKAPGPFPDVYGWSGWRFKDV